MSITKDSDTNYLCGAEGMDCSSPHSGRTREERDRKFHYSIAWTLLFLFIALPIGCSLAPIWVFLMIGEAFFPQVRDLNALLEKLITWPRLIGYAIKDGTDAFPSPLVPDGKS